MIKINGSEIRLGRFPDKTLALRIDEQPRSHAVIGWYYDGDEECMAIWNIVHHLRNLYPPIEIDLVLPYIPNARMDRVKNDNEVFTLKWFAEFVNYLRFENVYVLDAHSNVSLALIDRVVSLSTVDYVNHALEYIDNSANILFCYPDEGSAKRNSELYERDYVFGIKHRDWETGKIERLEITSPEKVSGRDVLIVDDICSKGGTFTYTAKALKVAGANKIYLYVSHCEDTIFNGDVLTDGLISHVFTTNSIFRGEHEMITVFGREYA